MRNGQIFDPSEADEFLRPYKAVLGGAIVGAFADYTGILRDDPNRTAGLSKFTRTRFVHDRTVHRLAIAEASGDYAGLRLVKIRGLWVVILRDTLMLKLKKLDANLRSRNILTGQTSAFNLQMPLLVESTTVTNATSGYVMDPLGSEIVRTVVVCWDDADQKWVSDLLDNPGEGGVVVTIPAGPAPTDLPSRTRIVGDDEEAAEQDDATASDAQQA